MTSRTPLAVPTNLAITSGLPPSFPLTLGGRPSELDTRTVTAGPIPDLRAYDVLAANLSGGKDSLAMLAALIGAAHEAEVADRVWSFHADLSPLDWPGVTASGTWWPSSRELAAYHSAAYGIPATRHIEVHRTIKQPDGTRRSQTLIEQIAARRRFPGFGTRFCTAAHKSGPIRAAYTPLINQMRQRLGRPVRVLTVLGLRAAESRARARRPSYRTILTNSARHLDEWNPIHAAPTAAVIEFNDASGLPHHWAYDAAPGLIGPWQGMSRLSCSLCVLSNRRDLLLAAARRPELAAMYAEVEDAVGEPFTERLPMRRILELAHAPDAPDPGIVLREDPADLAALRAAVSAELASSSPITSRCGAGCG